MFKKGLSKAQVALFCSVIFWEIDYRLKKKRPSTIAFWLSYSGTNRFNCFTCDRDTCRECGNAEMADAKNLKDDPLVLAKSIMKHRGSRTSVKVKGDEDSHILRSFFNQWKIQYF